MKKRTSFAVSCMIALGVTTFTHNASAATISQDPAWQTLNHYLQDAVAQNIPGMLSLSNDSRFAPGSASAGYAQLLKKPSDQLLSYTIQSETSTSINTAIFITQLQCQDGSTVQVPFTVVNTGSAWIVQITPDSLDHNYRVVQPATKAVSNQSTSVASPSLATGEIATWNFQGLNSTMYSIDTFSPNSLMYDHVTLHLQQDAEFVTPAAEIQYAVVQRQFFGDSVWGTPVVVNANVWGAPQNFTIYGPTANPSGCQLRFVNYYPTYSILAPNPDDGFGSAYEY